MKKPLSILSIFLGSVTALVGLWPIGIYIWLAVDAVDEADKSLIFWGLPILIIGFVILAAGLLFTIVAVKSLRSDAAYSWTKRILVAWVIIAPLVIIGNLINRQSAQKLSVQNQAQDTYLTTANKLSSLSIASHNTNGLDLTIGTSGGFNGEYSLQVKIFSDQAVFLDTAETIQLGASTVTVNKRIDYEGLFTLCGDSLKKVNVYLCVDNTMADTFMKVDAQLTPIRPQDTSLSISNEKLKLTTSSKRVEFSIETATQNQNVRVIKFTSI